MADADDVYRRLCREAQADEARDRRDWCERQPRIEARDRMLLGHLRHSLGGAVADRRHGLGRVAADRRPGGAG